MKLFHLMTGVFLLGLTLTAGCHSSQETKAPPPLSSRETSQLEILTQKIEKNGLIPLSKADVPLLLKKGEEAYDVVNGVELYEEKSIRKSTRGEGVGLSIRLIKGVTLHPSLFQSHPVIEKEMTRVDEGKLVVTNKRIVFIGTNKDLTADYKKILGVTPYADGFQIEREGRKTQELLKMSDPVTPLVYVTYIVNHLS
ncbi:MAG: hypothetical protein ACYDBV_06915 [Nitrospiria bacterium]